MVYRVYVEKKPGLANEAAALTEELKCFLSLSGLKKVRIINRYDVENISRELFDKCVSTVFSEPQVDDVSEQLPRAPDGAHRQNICAGRGVGRQSDCRRKKIRNKSRRSERGVFGIAGDACDGIRYA